MSTRWGAAKVGCCVDVPMSIWPRTWLRSARNFGKTRFRRSPSSQFSANKIFFAKILSRKSFYNFLVQFWRIYGETDVNGEFLAIFRSRWTYSRLSTTKNRPKSVRRRPEVCEVSTQHPPCPAPHLVDNCKRKSCYVDIVFYITCDVDIQKF